MVDLKEQTMNNITLSLIILTTTLIISGCTSSGDSSSKEVNISFYDGVSAKNYTRKVSGKVVDGYVKDARLKISSIGSGIQLPIYVNGKASDSLKSGSSGGFEFYLSGDEGNVSLSATNGVDTSTGETFEGSLETVIIQEDTVYGKRAQALSFQSANEVISPLTTLVAKQIHSGKTETEAKQSIATQLGIDEEMIKRDVIEVMKSGTPQERGNAAQAWKQGVTVQKIVESYSKSIGGASGSEAFGLISKKIYESVATLMEKGSSLENIVDDSTLVANQAVKDIKADSELTDSIGTVATALIDEKIEATRLVVATSIKTISLMDISKIVEATDVDSITDLLENSAKSIEMATKKVEESLEAISIATDVDGIDVAQLEATKVAEAIDEMGGLDKFEDIIIEAKESFSEGETLDISDFSDLIITNELVDDTSLLEDIVISNIAADAAVMDEDPIDDTVIDDTVIDDTVIDDTVIDDTVIDDTIIYDTTTTITVDQTINIAYINTVPVSSGIVSLEKIKVAITSTTLAAQYTELVGDLANMLDFCMSATSTATVFDSPKDVLVTVVIKKSGGTDYVAATTTSTFTKVDGNLEVQVASGTTFKVGVNVDGTSFVASKNTTNLNAITSSAGTINISSTQILDEFANNALIGDTIKQYMVDYATQAGSYDIYLMVNDAAVFSTSYIDATNSVEFDASSVNTITSGTLTNSVKIELTVN